MRNRLIGSPSVAVGVMVLAFASVLSAQTAARAGAADAKPIPRRPDGKPDLSGIWKTVTFQLGPIALTSWGLDQYNYNKLPQGNGVRPELDPILHCYRPGLARLGPPLQVPAGSVRVRIEGESVPAPGGPASLDLIQIAYAPRKVWIIYQYNQEVRQIFTDRRPHPPVDPDDLLSQWWNGHSVGTWDGDVFVVDTANIRNETWLDSLGHEHRQLKLVERFRRLDAETLEIERTFTDPMALARPYVTTATLQRTADSTFQENVLCDQYSVRKPGVGFGGLLGIADHPWQLPEENPNPTWEDVEQEREQQQQGNR